MRVLVTAGPTHEYIDDVRFISNPSSGQMGYAVAAAAARRGHDVVLVSGPSTLRPPRGVRVVKTVSAKEMLKATLEHFKQCNCLIMTAAVGDYRPETRVFGKIKKETRGTLTLRLVRNPDILAECGRRRRRGQVLIGFALESVGVRRRARSERGAAVSRPSRIHLPPRAALANAHDKLVRKGLDMIVLDSPRAFGAKNVDATVLTRGGEASVFAGISKAGLSARIVGKAEELFFRLS